MKFSRLFFFLLIVTTALSHQIYAQEIFEYTPPKPLDASPPKYPQRAAKNLTEGYVIYGFMIGADGKPYDPYVSESTSAIFEQPALNALKNLSYEPAKLNGEPVDAAHFYKFNFVMNGGVGVEPSFNRYYNRFHRALDDGDLEQASNHHETLSEKSTDNLYEMGWANLAGFRLAKAENQPLKQYAYLKKALAYHHGDYSNLTFLSKDQESSARAELFRLQVKLKYFAEASSTFRVMERRGDEFIETFRPVYKKILEVADDETGYTVDGLLDNDGGWSLGLHKRSFYIDGVVGRLSEIKLHCSAKYALFTYEEGAQYILPNSWGDCRLIVVGDPDTRLVVAQVPSTN